ncbi:MAG: ABC transporter permease [Cyclobacteriaceae bacterium]|nr:ABC transporter permease [Cyclobacteriaceae bacterium]
MVKNYFVLFVRNLKRQRLFSIINLLGLTVSIASTVLIYIYVTHEFSYDRFHAHADRIYRVNQTFIWGENSDNQFASTGPGVAYAIKEELAEVELITSLHTPGNFIVSYTTPTNEIIAFEEDKVLAADTNFFSMFNFPLLKGNAATAFKQANAVVMTKSTAQKYFGNADPVGKLVFLGGLGGGKQQTYEVTGVVDDTPDNSYIEFDMLLSMKGFPIERFYWSWVWTQLETFVRLSPTANVEQVKTKLAGIPRKHAEETLRRAMNTTFDDYLKSGKKWELFLQPMTGIHLPSETVINRLNDSGNRKIIYSFIGAAVFIVLLSCINFMNLSTAQFTRRIKEASVRKIMGLGKKELGIGYFFEAFTFCLLALITALALTQLLLPGFNQITEKSLEINLFNNPILLAALLGLTLLMATVSSSYPALFLSSFNPAEAIKGKLKIGKGGKSFRSGLVIFQFSVSIVLILCTAIVFQQLNFVSKKDIGFDKENLVVLSHLEAVQNGESLARAAMNIPGVEDASWCTSVPPRIWGGDTFSAEGMNGLTFPLNFAMADENYLPTLNIKLKFGRNFSIDTPGDVDRVILNEAAIQKIGWKADESIVGKKIEYDNSTFEVIGVMSDFNYWSLATPIEPMAVFHIKTKNLYDSDRKFLTLRIAPQSSEAWETTLASLQDLWKVHAGDSPFDYHLVDQAFAETFKSQAQFGKVLTIMAALAILIASLGLLGMIVYALEQRTKEIGIRKVSGASVTDILLLISKGYTHLILIAFLIGAPLSYWMMMKWLQDFSYRITPSVWIFVFTGLGTLVVAILITSYHSAKAALTNPIDVLKDE